MQAKYLVYRVSESGDKVLFVETDNEYEAFGLLEPYTHMSIECETVVGKQVVFDGVI